MNSMREIPACYILTDPHINRECIEQKKFTTMSIRADNSQPCPSERQPDKELKLKVYANTARSVVFRKAMTIAEDALLENSVPEDVGRPKKNFLKRVANRARAKLRPEEPKEVVGRVLHRQGRLSSCLYSDGKPATLRFRDGEPIVFAARHQTLVVGEPFRSNGQLFSIHAFIEKAGQLKQMPLAFCLMSRLQSIKERIGTASVEGFVADYEQAAWQAVRDVFPGVEVKGCAFHSSQAVWRHVQSVGLAEAYQRRIGVHNFVRMLLALQFLPVAHISPSSGCTKSKGNISFDRATQAELVKLAVDGSDLDRGSSKRSTQMDKSINKCWEQHLEGTLKTSQFLQTVGGIY
ncbi:hypothetical protein MAR_005414, partial [Mya arenaria]